MNKHLKNTLVLSSLFLSVHALAGIELSHVDSYDNAGNESLWKDVKADTVPSALINHSTIDNPALSYSQIFPKSFLQESDFAVCYQDCKNKDSVKVRSGVVESKDNDSLEQANVYFWLKRYFHFLDERFDFKPARHLKVMTNRSIKDPSAGKQMKNNAFFNPADVTLSFLPASNSIFFNVLKGKINRSGYDQSVISHEASHFFFSHLFPNAVNYEISGLNEGFADYIAHLHLNNPKVGLVMMRGKALRDASSLVDGQGQVKSYAPKLEAHDLGERISMVLWQTREQADNKEEFDRMVVDAVKSMSQNPFATAHSFKTEMMKRIPSVVSSSKMTAVNTLWEIVIPGAEAKATDLSFLSKPTTGNSYLGFKINQTVPKRFADEMGVEVHNDMGFSFIREVKLENNQSAMLMATEDETVTRPYWFIVDNRSGNILGIYGIDKKLVSNSNDLKNIKTLTDQVSSQNETISEFISKSRMFSDLAQGKGDLASGYKVTKTETIPDTLSFNGEPTAIERVELSLKKKLLVSILGGAPSIDKVIIYTIDLNIPALPLLNSKRVIGYKLVLANGTAMEMILNKYGKQQN